MSDLGTGPFHPSLVYKWRDVEIQSRFLMFVGTIQGQAIRPVSIDIPRIGVGKMRSCAKHVYLGKAYEKGYQEMKYTISCNPGMVYLGETAIEKYWRVVGMGNWPYHVQ